MWRTMKRIEHPAANWHWREAKQKYHMTKQEAKDYLESTKSEEVYQNDQYMAFVKKRTGQGRFENSDAVVGSFAADDQEFSWISFKRIDRKPVKDWRHVQNIKNDILGPEGEAVELYPAESRLTDTANQYHLWGYNNTDIRFPFGFLSRQVSDDAGNVEGAVQRPREE